MKNELDILVVEDGSPQAALPLETQRVDGLAFCLAIKHGPSLHPIPPLLLTSLTTEVTKRKQLEEHRNLGLEIFADTQRVW